MQLKLANAFDTPVTKKRPCANSLLSFIQMHKQTIQKLYRHTFQLFKQTSIEFSDNQRRGEWKIEKEWKKKVKSKKVVSCVGFYKQIVHVIIQRKIFTFNLTKMYWWAFQFEGCTYSPIFFSISLENFTWKSKVSRLISFYFMYLYILYSVPFAILHTSTVRYTQIFYCIWRLQSQENKTNSINYIMMCIESNVNMNVNDAIE